MVVVLFVKSGRKKQGKLKATTSSSSFSSEREKEKPVYRVSQKMYLCLMDCKIEIKCLISEILLVHERKFSN